MSDIRCYACSTLIMGLTILSAPGQESTQAARPQLSAAVIVVDQSPLGTLLESKLLELSEFRWVERSEIAKILAEQNLQSVLSPEAGQLRQKLSRLIGAERLVLLRSRQIEKQTYLEVAVAESTQGIRLLSRLTPLQGQDAAALAETLAAQLRGHLSRREEIRAIFTVPSFVSKDLGFEHDRLQAAYAALVQQRLMEQPGTVVVEIAEAEALARERLLSGADAQKQFAPYLILGEYRNSGREAARTISLSLTLRQGADELAAARSEVPPDQAPTLLSRQVETFLERVSGRKPLPANPKTEAKQLATRAQEFTKVGQWEEAFALLRAALLVDPENQDTRLKVIQHAAKLFAKHPNSASNFSIQSAQEAFSFCFVALDEGECFLQRGGQPTTLRNELSSMQPMFPHSDNEAEVRDFIIDAMNKRRSFYDRIGRRLLEQKHYSAISYLHESHMGLSTETRFARRLQLIEEFRDLPDNEQLLRALATSSSGARDLVVLSGGEHLVQQLINSKYEKLRTLGQKLEAEVAAEKEKMTREQAQLSRPSVPLQKLPFFDWYDDNGQKGKLAHPEFIGPVLPDADVVTFGPAIYVMREPGRLKRLWSSADRKAYFARWSGAGGAPPVCYDGRYLWARLLHETATARLLVIDMTTEKAFVIDSSHSFPTERPQQTTAHFAMESMALAALGPGRICAIGSIGGAAPRTWVALISYGSQGPHIEVIHEARNLRIPKDRDQWRSTELAFGPRMVFILEKKELSEQRLLALRGDATDGFRHYPLVVNPGARSVEVMPAGLPLAGLRAGVPHDQRDPLFVDGDPRTNEIRLCRVAFPANKVDVLAKIPREGYPLIHNDRLHIAGKQWWTGSLSGDDLKPVGECPWGYAHLWTHLAENKSYGQLSLTYITTTHHYGIVALYGGEGGLTLARVQPEE